MRTKKFSEHCNGTQWHASEQFRTPSNAVDWWYANFRDYSYELGPLNDPKTRNFTQVIWVASHKLGVGVARKAGMVAVVAKYDPPGNYPNTTAAFQQKTGKIGKYINMFHLLSVFLLLFTWETQLLSLPQ